MPITYEDGSGLGLGAPRKTFTPETLEIHQYPADSAEEEAFTPDSLTGLVLWLNASLGVKDLGGADCEDGEQVEDWQDQSGNGNHCSRVSGPIWRQSEINSLPAIEFTVSDHFTLDTPLAVGGSWTIFIGGRITQTQSLNFAVGFSESAASGISTGGTGGNDAVLIHSTSATRIDTTTAGMGTSFGVAIAEQDADTYTVWMDNAGNDSVTNAGYGLDTITRIGARGDANWDYQGDIAQILVYDSALSTADRTSVYDYLTGLYV